MPKPKSKIAADILKDRGVPQKLSPDERLDGAGMDGVDRAEHPVIEELGDATGTPAQKSAFTGQSGARGKPEGLR